MTLRRPALLRRQALALEPRFLLDAAAVTTAADVAAQAVPPTDTAPGMEATPTHSAVIITDDTTVFPPVDLFNDVDVQTETGGGEELNTLVITVNRSGGNQALVVDGKTILLEAGSGTTRGEADGYGYSYVVEVSGDTTTLTIQLNSFTFDPQDVSTLIDGLAYQARDNTVASGKVTVTLQSLSDSGGESIDLSDMQATIDIDNQINVPPVLSGGVLKEVERIISGGVANATDVAYSPDGKFAYVAGANNTILVFSVNEATGGLSHAQSLAVENLGQVNTLVASADGKSVYTLSSNGQLKHFNVGADGQLALASTLSTGPGSNGNLVISDDGKQLFANGNGGNARNAYVYDRDATTGELTQVQNLDSARNAILASGGNFVYIIQSDGTFFDPNVLRIYTRNENGTLGLVDEVFLTNTGYDPVAYTMAVSSDGKTLYLGDPENANLLVYHLGNDNLLTLANTVVSDNVASVALSDDGSTLYTLTASGTLSAYASGANGALTLTARVQGAPQGGDITVSQDGTSVLISGASGLQRYSPIQSLTHGQPVTLGDNLNLRDSNNDALDNGSGNYADASLTVQASQPGGTFGFESANGLTLSGGNLMRGADVVATFEVSDGTLSIRYNGSVTTEIANQVLRQITYVHDSATGGSLITLTITANDGKVDSAPLLMTLRVNTAPVLNDDAATGYVPTPVTTETPYEHVLPETLFSDGEGDALTWSVTGLPAGLVFDPATRTISGTSTDIGTHRITITVRDSAGASESHSVDIVISQIENRAPEANPDAAASLPSVVENTAGYQFTLPANLFTDADSVYGDTLSWAIVGNLPAGLSFDPATRTLSGTPTALGDYTIVIAVTDDAGETAQRELTLRVISAAEDNNSAPILGAPADLLTYTNDGKLTGYDRYVNSITLSADGLTLVIAGSTGTSVVGGASSGGASTLSVYSRDPATGALTLKQTFVQGTTDDLDASNGIEVDGLNAATNVTFSADGKFVFVAGNTGPDSKYGVSVFAVDASDNSLSFLSRIPNFDQKIIDMGVSKDGDTLFVLSSASSSASTLYTYAIGEDGSLTLKQSLKPLYDLGFNAAAKELGIDDNGTVYAMSNGRMAIYAYDADSKMLSYKGLIQSAGGIVYRQYAGNVNGVETFNTLTLASTGAFGNSYAMAVSGDGNVYVTTHNNFTVLAFKFDAVSNTVTLVDSIVTPNPDMPTGVATSSDGSTLYVTYGFSNKVAIYRVGDDGDLTFVQSVQTSIDRPFKILVTADNQLLLGSNVASGSTGLGFLTGRATTVAGGYTEGTAGRVTADLTLSDAEYDAKDDYDGATLTLAREGAPSDWDSFGFADNDSLKLAGSEITRNGETIASFTSANGKLTLVFTGTVSKAVANEVLQRITYTNGHPNPGDSVRLTLTVQDEFASGKTQLTLDLAITHVNTPPVLDGGGTVPYTELAEPVPIAPGATVKDVQMDYLNGEAGNYNNATLTITLGEGKSTADVLGFKAGNGLTLNGTTLEKDGVEIGQLTISDGVMTIRFSDAAGTLPTTEDVQNTLRQVTYANRSNVPGERVAISVVLADQLGLASTALALAIDITAVNDAPVVGPDPVSSLGELSDVQTLASVAGLGTLATSTTSADGTVVYLADTQGAIALFQRDAQSGALTYVDTLAATEGLNGVRQLTLSADGKSLYALSGDGNAIVTFSVDGEGELTHVATLVSDYDIDQSELFNVRAMAVSEDGRHLYLINADSKLITLARDTGTGVVRYVGSIEGGMWGPPYLWAPTDIAVRGDLVFVVTNPNNGSSLIVYRRDADGALTEFARLRSDEADANGQAITLSNIKHLTVSADGRTIFIANSSIETWDGSGEWTDHPQAVHAIHLDADAGTLTHLGTITGDKVVRGIALSADGRALFVTLSDGSLNYYATATLALLETQQGLSGAGQVLVSAGDGVIVVGDALNVLRTAAAPGPVAVIGGDPVLLAPTLEVRDAELDAAADGAGNYQDASFILTGQAGDLFGVLAGQGYTVDGDTVLLDGQAVATLTQAGGTATLRITAALTREQANALLRQVSYASSADNTVGSRSVTVRLNDGEADSAAHTVEITLREPNRAPEDSGEPFTADEALRDRPYSLVLPETLFTDADGDTLAWEVSGLPDGLGFDAGTRTISGSATASGSHTITITVTDPEGKTATRTFTLDIAEPPNTAPVDSGIVVTPDTARIGEAYSYTLPAGLFTDADGDTLTWQMQGLPEGLVFDPNTRTVYGRAQAIGTYVLTVSATDPSGASISRAVTLAVAEPIVVPNPDPGTGTAPGTTPAPGTPADVPLPDLITLQRTDVFNTRVPVDAEDNVTWFTSQAFAPTQPVVADRLASGLRDAPDGVQPRHAAQVLDQLLADSLERRDANDRAPWQMETPNGTASRLVVLAGPDAQGLSASVASLAGVWRNDVAGNRQVFTLPAGLIRSTDPIAAIGLRMADGSPLPAGLRLDATRGLIVAPGLTGAERLSLVLVVRNAAGDTLSLPITLSASRPVAWMPVHDAAQEDADTVAHKPALSQQLRQTAAQDLLDQARLFLASLGDDAQTVPARASQDAQPAAPLTVES